MSAVDLSCRPVALAVELARAGADVVVVGGTARRLRGAVHAPRDLDVAVVPAAVDGLVEALDGLGVRTTAARLLRCGCSPLTTAYGPLDVFVGPQPPCGPVPTGGVVLAVAT